MTQTEQDREAVLAKWPKAGVADFSGVTGKPDHYVFRNWIDPEPIGRGDTAAAAWADAARRITQIGGDS